MQNRKVLCSVCKKVTAILCVYIRYPIYANGIQMNLKMASGGTKVFKTDNSGLMGFLHRMHMLM